MGASQSEPDLVRAVETRSDSVQEYQLNWFALILTDARPGHSAISRNFFELHGANPIDYQLSFLRRKAKYLPNENILWLVDRERYDDYLDLGVSRGILAENIVVYDIKEISAGKASPANFGATQSALTLHQQLQVRNTDENTYFVVLSSDVIVTSQNFCLADLMVACEGADGAVPSNEAFALTNAAQLTEVVPFFAAQKSKFMDFLADFPGISNLGHNLRSILIQWFGKIVCDTGN